MFHPTEAGMPEQHEDYRFRHKYPKTFDAFKAYAEKIGAVVTQVKANATLFLNPLGDVIASWDASDPKNTWMLVKEDVPEDAIQRRTDHDNEVEEQKAGPMSLNDVITNMLTPRSASDIVQEGVPSDIKPSETPKCDGHTKQVYEFMLKQWERIQKEASERMIEPDKYWAYMIAGLKKVTDVNEVALLDFGVPAAVVVETLSPGEITKGLRKFRGRSRRDTLQDTLNGEPVQLSTGEIYELIGSVAGTALKKGDLVAAYYRSTNEGMDFLEVLGVTGNDTKYGETEDGNPNIKYDSVQACLKANGVRSLSALNDKQDADGQAKYGEKVADWYGYDHYLVVRDLESGDSGPWYYIYKGRWARGSGAEQLSFYRIEKTAEVSVDEAADPKAAPAPAAPAKADDKAPAAKPKAFEYKTLHVHRKGGKVEKIPLEQVYPKLEPFTKKHFKHPREALMMSHPDQVLKVFQKLYGADVEQWSVPAEKNEATQAPVFAALFATELLKGVKSKFVEDKALWFEAFDKADRKQLELLFPNVQSQYLDVIINESKTVLDEIGDEQVNKLFPNIDATLLVGLKEAELAALVGKLAG